MDDAGVTLLISAARGGGEGVNSEGKIGGTEHQSCGLPRIEKKK